LILLVFLNIILQKTSKFLITIVGPTAVGKTNLAIKLAKNFKTIIVSADSRQFYKEMSIGTAKPSQDELSEVPHFFIDNLSIHDTYNVGKYEAEVIDLLNKQFETYDFIILVGGSGLYIQAVIEGLDELPDVDLEIRRALNSRLKMEGIEVLLSDLEKLDRTYFNIVDKKNPQRVIRALEVCMSTGLSYSSYRIKKNPTRNFIPVKIGLNMERSHLYHKIDARVNMMLEQGLIDEVRNLYSFKDLNALQTVGYKELFEWIDEKISLDKSIDLIKQNTRHFAKRQLTWFNKDRAINWFLPTDSEEIFEFIAIEIKKMSKT
jgi:tRNA dimethylallyltransferase